MREFGVGAVGSVDHREVTDRAYSPERKSTPKEVHVKGANTMVGETSRLHLLSAIFAMKRWFYIVLGVLIGTALLYSIVEFISPETTLWR